MTHKTSQPRIVVGFSHSAASVSALLWAVREAALRDAQVAPVHAWQWSGEGRASYAPMRDWRCRDEEQAAVRDSVTEAVSAVDRDLAPLVVHGPAAQVLLQQSERADLLVLGGRPFDPESPAPIGPVISACLLRAACPVVVVTPDMLPAEHGRTDGLALAGIPPRP